MAETVTTSNSSVDELFDHPKGLYFCFSTELELWERFSFYGMKFLLLLYVTKYHLFSDGEGLEVLGAYAGLVYALPVIGGMLADTILTQTIKIQDLAALNVFYLALALIVVGVGFFKPNILTIVGQLYEQDDPRRVSGFKIFYMGINLGSFAATIICVYLGEAYGWGYCFGAARIGM